MALALAGMTAWVRMETAAGNGWSLEPASDRAIAAAAAARIPGIVWAMALVAAAVALAGATRRRWLAVLALPGVVVALLLLFAPRSNGSAFFYGLVTSLVAVMVAVLLEVRHRLRRR